MCPACFQSAAGRGRPTSWIQPVLWPGLEPGSGRVVFACCPYRAVGVDRGLLLALKVDSLNLGGKERGPLLVALSPTPVSDGGGYRALIGPLDGKDECT